jgi:hypothetical protein
MRTIGLMKLVALLITLCSCTMNSALIERGSANTRNDVFQMMAGGAEPLPGYSRLSITCSLKRVPTGGDRVDGLQKPLGSTLVINIDGQSVRIPVVSSREEGDDFGVHGPEAGRGFRQSFAAHLQVAAGTHRLIAVIPEEHVGIEKEIIVVAGSENFLQLKPRYRGSPLTRLPETSFREGLAGLTAVLNGKDI